MKFFIILFCLLLPVISFGAVVNIDRIVFVTEPQTILPDTISKAFTIQTQNSSGTIEPIDETSDLSLSVTSATGQFNSNSTTWNPAKTFTMSKNTGNKNFYYKDSTLGTYTINATLTTRTTGKSWNTSQVVNISNDINTATTTNTTATTTDTTFSTSTATTTTIISTHYIQEYLSTYVEPTNIFELTAGRNRLGYLNLPLNFEAKYKMSSDLKNSGCHFLWTFGDGSSEKGERVEHTYKYLGEYNLVLNGDCNTAKSVARSTVKVVETNLSLSNYSDGAVKIINSGEYEINLYGWRLSAGKKVYEFPLDTIISAGQSVIFPREYTELDGYSQTRLIDAKDNIIAQTELSPMTEELVRFIEEYKRLTSS